VTEDEARAWLAARFPAPRLALLDAYVRLLLEENERQNLIAKASVAQIWARHIVDSAQLLGFAPAAENWLDVGSGPGLPGLVLACVNTAPITLVEPRARRAAFLTAARLALGLDHVTVQPVTVARMPAGRFAAVTARAYAPLPEIFASTIRLTDPSTIWILPKGRSAESELAAARAAWHGAFHVEQSVTDPDAKILVATNIRQVRR
jgi:16S rRNA (guanine527-N7)-methyltransferase